MNIGKLIKIKKGRYEGCRGVILESYPITTINGNIKMMYKVETIIPFGEYGTIESIIDISGDKITIIK